MNKKTPKVSVIVPVYNTEKYLDICLSSLVRQTLDDIEIIVVNDGSPDNSQEIIDRFAEEHPGKVVAIGQENAGIGPARNFAMQYAKGEYIGFCDSDDRVSEDMYETMYKTAKADGSDVVICDFYNEIELADKTRKTDDRNPVYSGFPCNEGTPETVENFVLHSTGAAYVWNKIFRRELLQKTPFISAGFFDDIASTPVLLSNCEKIMYIKKPLYRYLRRADSGVEQADDPRNLGVIDAWKRCLDECNPKYKDEVAYAVYFSLCWFLDGKKAHMADYVMFFIQNNDHFRHNRYIEEAVQGKGLADLFAFFGKYIKPQ